LASDTAASAPLTSARGQPNSVAMVTRNTPNTAVTVGVTPSALPTVPAKTTPAPVDEDAEALGDEK
jgi:hypothetical protein